MTYPALPDGVHEVDGVWEAWLNGDMVAVGPDKPIIEAAYRYHPRNQEA